MESKRLAEQQAHRDKERERDGILLFLIHITKYTGANSHNAHTPLAYVRVENVLHIWS